jgi:hypothetical protein
MHYEFGVNCCSYRGCLSDETSSLKLQYSAAGLAEMIMVFAKHKFGTSEYKICNMTYKQKSTAEYCDRCVTAGYYPALRENEVKVLKLWV